MERGCAGGGVAQGKPLVVACTMDYGGRAFDRQRQKWRKSVGNLESIN